MQWHTLPLGRIETQLATGFRTGLSSEEAASRLTRYGPNALPAAKSEGGAIIFLRQFQSPLIYILLAAGAIVYLLGDAADAVIIAVVLLFNAIVGTIQEGRAHNTLRALREFTETNATALRDGKEIIISDRELVPGDIILLTEGERVPADARIVESAGLEVNEAALTGESLPVEKREGVLRNPDSSLTAQYNMVCKGTYVTKGSAQAAVVATGTNTVIGGITAAIATMDTDIPLKADLRALSTLIIAAVGVISIAFFAIGIAQGREVQEMFRAVVSLAVSLIPEGLPVVLTVILAAGAWRMAKRHALVKRLQAVEGLGQIGVIAVDKTGTLTKNEMVIREVWIDGNAYAVEGSGYEPQGTIEHAGAVVNPPSHADLLLAGKVAAFCAASAPVFSESKHEWGVHGDPTEAAMAVFAEKIGFHRTDLLAESPLLLDMPFDYRTKYHIRSHRLLDRQFFTIAGAPEHILAVCDRIYHNGKAEPITPALRGEAEHAFHGLSKRGFRVVAFGYNELALSASSDRFIFAGFYAMEDSLRPEVPEAMASAAAAGVKVVMITGDHALTAEAIAREAGIFRSGERIVTGEEMDRMDNGVLARAVSHVRVFARVTPAHKLRIIEAFRARGELIAMTGDGVNDAPSLVAADLGVAMGKIGTEVAKEASDIVLLDDNFGTIIAAMEEGRNIFQTIKKVILYLFSTSLGELFAIVGAVSLGYPLPLAPVQILWLNLVTDGFLVVALAMEPKEPGLLSRPFRKPPKFFIDRAMVVRMFLMGFVMASGTFAMFRVFAPHDLMRSWSITLTVLAVFQWFNAWNCRREDTSIFRMNPFSNIALVFATVIVLCLQLAALYTPWLQAVLRTAPLTLAEWGIILAVASTVVVVEELRKYIARRTRVVV